MTSPGDDEALERTPGEPGAGEDPEPDQERPPEEELGSDEERRSEEERRSDEEHGSDDDPGRGTGPAAPDEALMGLRARILELDASLVRLVGERRRLVLEIGRAKEEAGMPVMDPEREARVVRRAARIAREEGVDEEMVRDILWRIIASAREAQEDRTSWGPPDPQ